MMSRPRKQSKKELPKHGMNSISEMFKKQNEFKKNRAVDKQLLESSKKSVIQIESSDSDVSESESAESCCDTTKVADTELPNQQYKLSKDRQSIRGKEIKQQEEINVSSTVKSRLSLKRKSSESDIKAKKKIDIDNPFTFAQNKISTGEGANLESNSFQKVNRIDNSIGSVENNHALHKEEENTGDQQIEYREPYYQRNFETILNHILTDTDVSALFNDADNSVMNSYSSLSEKAKQVYVRLFGRKFKWIPSSKIKYPEIGENLTPYLQELTDLQLVFDEKSLTDLCDVLETLTAGDIKTMAKTYHVTPSITQKKQIIEELLKLCSRSTVSSMFGSKGGVTASMLKKSKSMVHGAYKLRQEPRSVFIRVMTLFSLVNTTGDEESGNGGQGQLFQMLMVNMGKVVYPSYNIIKEHQVFKTRDDVIRFENALQLESDLLNVIDKGNWSGAYDCYCLISKELEKLQQDKEIAKWNESLPDFLRSFTAMSVLYRLLSQGIDILQRRKEYNDAVTLIRKLLDQELYCCTHRGYWWERLALNLDVHLKNPSQSLDSVAAGLKDHQVIGGHRLGLYQRAESICNRPRLKLKQRISEFHHDPIKEIPKVFIEGRILHQGVTSSGPRFLTEGSYANGNAQEMTVCGVEEFVMEHYRKNGYPSGLHAEGSIVTSLFGLFFWDILFMPVPDAFHSLYQAQPLDLYTTSAFYKARREVIDERLAEIEKSLSESLNGMVEEIWNREFGKLCVGLSWERFSSIEDVKGLVQCMGGKALSGILSRYAKCPRHTRSGFPDLTLWNVNTGAWKICEVKGPGDKLSHKQILWLDYLLGLGVDAEVCHVKAVAAKKLRPST